MTFEFPDKKESPRDVLRDMRNKFTFHHFIAAQKSESQEEKQDKAFQQIKKLLGEYPYTTMLDTKSIERALKNTDLEPEGVFLAEKFNGMVRDFSTSTAEKIHLPGESVFSLIMRLKLYSKSEAVTDLPFPSSNSSWLWKSTSERNKN